MSDENRVFSTEELGCEIVPLHIPDGVKDDVKVIAQESLSSEGGIVPGAYKFVMPASIRGESVERIGAIILSPLRIDLRDDLNGVEQLNKYKHSDISGAVGLSPVECMGGLVFVDAQGNMVIGRKPIIAGSVGPDFISNDVFKKAFDLSCIVSRKLGVTLVSIDLLDKVHAGH